jgi:hypothetical protein
LRFGIPGPVVMVKKETYDKEKGIGLYDENLIGEDRDFYLRLLARNAICYIDKPVAAWRIVTNSLSRNMINRKNVLPYWYETDKKHINSFSGLSRIFLLITMIRIKTEINILNNNNIINHIIHFIFRAISKAAYYLHYFRTTLFTTFTK